MKTYHANRFPGESSAYRTARNELLQAEIDLRKQIERVAELRRNLPEGGLLKEDYIFEQRTPNQAHIQFSELFKPNKNSLVIYSFMYAPENDTPCPACTSILDALNGIAPHVQDKLNLAVVAKAPINKIHAWADKRNWTQLNLLSSNNNSYNNDYFAEQDDNAQIPAINVFNKTATGIYHFWNAELLYAPTEAGQHPRHADFIWPLWNMFDITPEGRGTEWFPKLAY